MKVSCLQETMRRGMQIAKRITPARTSIPITQTTLIRTREGAIELTATNLEMAVRMTLPAMVEEHGEVAVPNGLLAGFIDTLPHEPIVMEKQEDRQVLKLRCGNNKANINGENPDTFPPIPNVENPTTAVISRDQFRKAVNRVIFCTASEMSGRPILAGILMVLDENRLTTVAADGFRIGVQHTGLMEYVAERREIVVPAKALQEVQNIMAHGGDTLEVMMSENGRNVRFRITDEGQQDNMDMEVTSVLLEGNYPDYNALIPKNSPNRALFDVGALNHAARRAALFARDDNRTVKIEMNHEADGPPRAVVYSEAKELGNNRAEIVMNGMEGEDMNISFNNKYLTDVLACLQADELLLETSDRRSPAKISISDVDEYSYVMMPIIALDT